MDQRWMKRSPGFCYLDEEGQLHNWRYADVGGGSTEQGDISAALTDEHSGRHGYRLSVAVRLERV